MRMFIQSLKHGLSFLIFLVSGLSVQAQIENSLSFDGVNDVVNIPGASAQIAASTAGMSLSCWVYANNTAPSFPNFDGIAGFRNETNCDFYLLQLSSTTIEGRFRNSVGTPYTATASGFVVNTWQHLVLTYDGSNLMVFINGVQKASVSASGSINSVTEIMYLGNLPFQTTNFQFGGQLDEVALWNKALSAAEISCMYQNGHDNSSPNLKLHYTFDQGTPNGTNTGITSLIDNKGNINGFLNGFALTGNSSNFTNGVVQGGSFTAKVCQGDSVAFGSTYYSTPGTYYVSIPIAGGCDSISKMVLTVDTVDVGVTVTISTGNAYRADAVGATYQWIDCITKQPIPGATFRSFIPSTGGSFAVVVDNGTCSDTSACVISTVGLDENQRTKVSVFPNPSKGKFIFDQGYDTEAGTLYLLNSAGKIMAEFKVENRRETVIDLELNPGVYLLNFQREDGKQGTAQLVVEP